MGRLRSSLTVAVLLATGACGGPDKVEAPEPTVPTAPSTTTIAATTTTAADPFTTPAKIDAAYVERVLAELNRVYGDTARKIVETRRYERSDIDPLGAIFNPPLLQLQVNEFRNILDLDPKMFKSPMGYRRMKVLEVITARPDCIFTKVSTDVSDVVISPPPILESYITLGLKPADADPSGKNPTPWAMNNESDARENPCA